MSTRNRFLVVAGILGLVASGGAVAYTAHTTHPAAPPPALATLPRAVRVQEVAAPAEAGQVVAEGQVVARLARDGEREAVVSLPEKLADAARSARATVTLWAAPGESYPAALRELSPIADPITRTYQARFTIRNPGPKVVL